MAKYLLLLLMAVSLLACTNTGKKNEPVTKTKNKKSILKEKETPESPTVEGEQFVTNSEASILHRIIVHESGNLKIARAFLSLEDGSLLPKSNKIKLGETVYLNLLVDKGWKVKDGFVSIDAAERITTNEGELVLNAPALFQSLPYIEESRANSIVLKATITKTRPDIDHFIVNYRVWDLRGDSEVKGSYRIYIETVD